MKKTYQIERDIRIDAGKTAIINTQLKENYARCTGFFLTPYKAGTDFMALTLGLNIAQQEILPINTDSSLFALTDYIGRADATYDFSEENIPARSSDVQLTITNTSDSAQIVNAYFILKND